MSEQVKEELCRLLTETEVADLLSVERNTLAKWRCKASGGPEWIRLGKRLIRYPETAIRKWLAEQSQDSAK